MTFDYNQKQPVYEQLVDELRKSIKENYQPNDKLLSEREIMKRYSVSRNTVRQALNELEIIGYIYRQHGKGTFVANWATNNSKIGDEYSFTEQMKALGKKPETKILEYSILNANEYFAKRLNLNPGTKIIKLKRLRKADGLPMMIDRTYIPYDKFSTLSVEDLEVNQRALYSIFLEDFSEKVKLADEDIYAGICSEKDAGTLGISEGSPCLMLRRTTYNPKNEIIEYTISCARGDQFVYNIKYQH